MQQQQYKPEVPLMTIRATANELIALGWVMTYYLEYLERAAPKTEDQLEFMALLRGFQQRVREVQR